ncbi:MAG: 50S ribosomal protein L10 [Rhodospirillales bacterium]|nr:50S ribosomal protein L10 [Rhodospirillales bacterium]
MNRAEKQALVQSLATIFRTTEMVVVGRNRGLTVTEASDLRRRMRSAGATYRVAKNSLAARALAGSRFTGLAPLLKGPTALAWSADPVAVAKVAVSFARTNDRFVVVGGALGPRALEAGAVEALAELPSLDVLRAGLVGLLHMPAERLAAVLAAPAGGLARVFGAYART